MAARASGRGESRFHRAQAGAAPKSLAQSPQVLAAAGLALLCCWPAPCNASPPSTPPARAPAATPAAPAAEHSGDWIFDRGLYTNDPSTGKRVRQYEHERRAYRDPYAIFDSPHESFPFSPDPGYGEYPYYNGLLPYYFQHWGGGGAFQPLPSGD